MSQSEEFGFYSEFVNLFSSAVSVSLFFATLWFLGLVKLVLNLRSVISFILYQTR